jgi:hypothetical protein
MEAAKTVNARSLVGILVLWSGSIALRCSGPAAQTLQPAKHSGLVTQKTKPTTDHTDPTDRSRE